MVVWYKELSARERRTFWGCFAGWALDAMDVQVFSFLIPTLVAAWGISQVQAGFLGTSALVASAVGGWIGGILSDRYGRVRVMQFTVLWFAAFTCLSGFTNNFDQLLVVRCLQGLGFGGEWAAGAVLMGEIIRPAHRGKAVGTVQSGYAIGWGAAALLSSLAFATLPDAYAWRAIFWVGLLPALLVIYIRRFIEEPEVFETARRADRAAGIQTRPLDIFRRPLLRTTLLASLLALGVQGSSYAIITWLPTFLRTVRHLSSVGAGSYVAVVTLGAFCGYLTSAYLTDAIGRRRNFLIFAVCCWIVDFVYMYVPFGNETVLLLGLPFGFFTQGIYASLGPYFTELFPTRVRATGQSFAYNLGRSLGAFFIAGIGMLAQVIPLAQAIGMLSLGGYLIAIVATLLLPETKGIELDQVAAGSEPLPRPSSMSAAD
jgi:MFS family permease